MRPESLVVYEKIGPKFEEIPGLNVVPWPECIASESLADTVRVHRDDSKGPTVLKIDTPGRAGLLVVRDCDFKDAAVAFVAANWGVTRAAIRRMRGLEPYPEDDPVAETVALIDKES
jgi:hypothetical protein